MQPRSVIKNSDTLRCKEPIHLDHSISGGQFYKTRKRIFNLTHDLDSRFLQILSVQIKGFLTNLTKKGPGAGIQSL